MWLCLCDCGREHLVAGGNLRSGGTSSCGCKRGTLISEANSKHGQSGDDSTPTYLSWKSMHNRCRSHPRYHGRGIAICSRWSSFENFLADMGERPPRTSLERKDNNLGYTPENCIWATAKEQARNRETSHQLTFNGRTLSIIEWAEEIGVSERVISQRIQYGWSAERALTTPIRRYQRKQRERSL